MAPPPLPPPPGTTAEQLENMVAGRPYLASDKYLDVLRVRTAQLLHKGNAETDMTKRMEIYSEFLEFRKGDRNGAFMVQPFTCEYVSARRRPPQVAAGARASWTRARCDERRCLRLEGGGWR